MWKLAFTIITHGTHAHTVEIHEMLQAANPNPNPSPNLNLRPSLALVLTQILTLTPQENFERLSVAERRPYEEESEMDLGRHRTACEAHAASKEAAQKLCFTKNKQAASPNPSPSPSPNPSPNPIFNPNPNPNTNPDPNSDPNQVP